MRSFLASVSIATCVGQDVFLATPARTASKADLARAKATRQNGRLAGSTPQEIADKINGHITNLGLPTKQCTEYTLSELNDLVREMFPHLNQDLSEIYGDVDRRSRRFATLAEYETNWENDAEHAVEVIRDAKCAEAIMLWAHHLSEGGKNTFGKRELPILPAYDAEKASSKTYAEALSCQTGHAMVKGGDGTSSHSWPDWPEELHYTAMAHGAYPFWWIQGFQHENDAALMEVWWSEKQGAEKFAHTSCSGYYNWLDGSACYHLMLAPTAAGVYNSYLYNEAAEQGKTAAEGAECCLSSPSASTGPGPKEVLAPSQGNFWNTFTDMGETDFNGVYYQGKAHYYVMTGVSEPVREFWYFTDLDGKPVQQGEAGTGPTDQGYPTSIGHTIWHDYDPATLDSSAIDASVFMVPAFCQTTTSKCAFP